MSKTALPYIADPGLYSLVPDDETIGLCLYSVGCTREANIERADGLPMCSPCMVQAGVGEAPTPTKAKKPCKCGCGETPLGAKSEFMPGHDARYHAALRKAAKEKGLPS
jgi:hypothetical protein